MNRHFSFFLASALLLSISAGLTTPLRADSIVSTFEENDLASQLDASNTFRGMIGPQGQQIPSVFKSGAVTFSNEGAGYEDFGPFRYEFWEGNGFARRTSTGGEPLYSNGNDLISKPAVGSDGSQTWGVAYASGTLKADAGYRFESLDLTNTLYTWTSMSLGDSFDPKFGAGDYFTVRFTNPVSAAVLDIDLANFRNGDSTIIEDWRSVDLRALDAPELSVSFLGSRNNGIGVTTPTYVAFDNVSVQSITAVPEPSSLALVGAAGAAIAWYRRRRRTDSATGISH